MNERERKRESEAGAAARSSTAPPPPSFTLLPFLSLFCYHRLFFIFGGIKSFLSSVFTALLLLLCLPQLSGFKTKMGRAPQIMLLPNPTGFCRVMNYLYFYICLSHTHFHWRFTCRFMVHIILSAAEYSLTPVLTR